MHESKTLNSENQTIYKTESLFGFGRMEGNSINEKSLQILTSQKKSGKRNSEYINLALTDTELIDKLMKLYKFKTEMLDKGYYTGIGGLGEFKLSAIQYRYDQVFSDNPVTTQDADEFMEKVNTNGIEEYKKGVSSLYYSDIDTLVEFFNGGTEIVNTVQKDGMAYIYRIKTFDEMYTLVKNITNMDSEYSRISQRALSNDLTQEDVSKVSTNIENLKKFINDYTTTTDEVIKTFFEANIEAAQSNLITYEEFLQKAPGYLQKAEKKRTALGDNPSISAEGGSYVDKSEKAGKEDKANKSVHKFMGTYDKKADEYSIYKKGKKDENEIDINDVEQGVLGDCYLISSIASVARKKPEYIKSLISYTKGSSTATVTLYMMNQKTSKREPTPITVDFYFPMKELQPAYAKKGDNELWVMLIEKAYAKIMGGYDNIISGSPAEALAVLTGNESSDTATESKDLQKELTQSVASNNAAVAGTKTDQQIKDMNDPKYKATKQEGSTTFIVSLPKGRSIICNHAYSILEYSETNNEIKIRNPHGGEEAEFTITMEEFKACFTNLYYSKIND